MAPKLVAVLLLAVGSAPKLVKAAAAVVAPVPPLATAIVVPFHVPLVIVPRLHPFVPSCWARMFPAPSAKIMFLVRVGDKATEFPTREPIIVFSEPVVIPRPLE